MGAVAEEEEAAGAGTVCWELMLLEEDWEAVVWTFVDVCELAVALVVLD
jgi:hypothetical protein